MTYHLMKELADRCEKATGPDRELDVAITVAMAGNTGLVEAAGNDCERGTYWVTLDSGGKSLKTATRWTASLDAAMQLVPEGHVFCVTNVGVDHPTEPDWSRASAIVGKAADPKRGYTVAETPALALCAAALRSRASMEKGE